MQEIKNNYAKKSWGCNGFDRKMNGCISVCVVPIYEKSGKKISADSDNIGATDVALAA